MHIFFWFLSKHIITLTLFSFTFVQCKQKKKFQSDNKAQLVDPNTPESPKSVKDVHRPVSQVPPTLMPIESPTKNKVNEDTLANVASIKPDFSVGGPPVPV